MQIQILAEDRASRHLAALGVLLGSVPGAAEEAKRVTCDWCGGTGTRTDHRGREVTCDLCGGTGEVWGQ